MIKLQPKPINKEQMMALKTNDLKDLVGKKIHIDEYSSKMGEDSDVIVTSMKVDYYDPALELSNFLEKGYEWVLDADVSSGEMEDGGYLVFIESLRRPSYPNNIMSMLKDLENITGNSMDEYQFSHRDDKAYQPVTADAIKAQVPLSPRDYPQQEIPMDAEESKMLESMQMAAGLTPKAKAVTDPILKHFVNLSKR